MVADIFSMIDRKATIENADTFLRKYMFKLSLKRNRDIAAKFKPKSPSYDGMPKAPNYTNHVQEKVEKFIIKTEMAGYYCDLCTEAIDSLEHNYRVILTMKYLERFNSDYKIMHKVNLQSTRYYEIKKDALIAFAEIFPLYLIDNQNSTLLIYRKKADKKRRDGGDKADN